jgi:hypothetical protein
MCDRHHKAADSISSGPAYERIEAVFNLKETTAMRERDHLTVSEKKKNATPGRDRDMRPLRHDELELVTGAGTAVESAPAVNRSIYGG